MRSGAAQLDHLFMSPSPRVYNRFFLIDELGSCGQTTMGGDLYRRGSFNGLLSWGPWAIPLIHEVPDLYRTRLCKREPVLALFWIK